MRVFVSSRQIHHERSDEVKLSLLRASKDQVAILQQSEHAEDWKEKAERKIRESDFVLFILQGNTFDSENLRWEFEKAKTLNKRIVGFRSTNTPHESVLYCE